MARLNNEFTQFGYRVLVVPEVATLSMIGGGDVVVGRMERTKAIQRQQHIIKMQMDTEDYFTRLGDILSRDRPVIILCDRGMLDGKAYVTEDFFLAILNRMNTSREAIMNRYSSICHLVTAADGAAKYYTLENNEARTETREEARA